MIEKKTENAVEYNRELCQYRHDEIEKTFKRSFVMIEKLNGKVGWFIMLIIATLATGIANLIFK